MRSTTLIKLTEAIGNIITKINKRLFIEHSSISRPYI